MKICTVTKYLFKLPIPSIESCYECGHRYIEWEMRGFFPLKWEDKETSFLEEMSHIIQNDKIYFINEDYMYHSEPWKGHLKDYSQSINLTDKGTTIENLGVVYVGDHKIIDVREDKHSK